MAGRAPAGNTETPDLKPFAEEMRQLILQHYPKATVEVKGQSIHFEFNTRTFMIHEPLMTGQWQDARPEVGPQPGGSCGDITLEKGKYLGQAAVPQTFDKRYFVLLVMAPYSEKLDHHLYAHLASPHDAPEEFLAEFQNLVNNFESYIPTAERQESCHQIVLQQN